MLRPPVPLPIPAHCAYSYSRRGLRALPYSERFRDASKTASFITCGVPRSTCRLRTGTTAPPWASIDVIAVSRLCHATRDTRRSLHMRAFWRRARRRPSRHMMLQLAPSKCLTNTPPDGGRCALADGKCGAAKEGPRRLLSGTDCPGFQCSLQGEVAGGPRAPTGARHGSAGGPARPGASALGPEGAPAGPQGPRRGLCRVLYGLAVCWRGAPAVCTMHQPAGSRRPAGALAADLAACQGATGLAAQ